MITKEYFDKNKKLGICDSCKNNKEVTVVLQMYNSWPDTNTLVGTYVLCWNCIQIKEQL